MNIFELFGKVAIDGLDKTKEQLSGLDANVQKVQKGMKIMGAAFTAVGVAGLAMIQSTKKINADLGVTALTLGITTKEMRDLTLATTNVTFPIKEVTATFDLLARAGIKDQEVLKATATAFDTLGDALKMGASAVTEIMVPAMKTFRLSAEEIAGKTDMMTYMVRNSTISLEDFNTMVGYTSQDMVDAGLTIDDMAAAMMYMSDNGVEPGKVMLREWNKAVTQSQEEGIALTEALGMTSEELERYKSGLAGATGMAQEYADVANKQYTIMDKMKQKWSELTLKASGFLEPMEPLLAGMTAMGPMMIFLGSSAGTAAVKWGLHTGALIAHKVALLASAVATKIVTAAQWLWNAAMAANPIGLIILAIAGLIAMIVLVVKNWDWVKEKAGELWSKLKEVWDNIVGFFRAGWDRIVGFFKENWEKILLILFPVVGLAVLIARNWDKIVDAVKGIWNKVVDVFKNIWSTAAEWGKDLVRGLWEGIKSLASWIWDKVTGWAKNLWGSITSFFGFGSPSRLAIEAGIDIAKGLAEGVESGVKDALSGIRASMEDIEAEITLRRPAGFPITASAVVSPAGVSITNIFPIAQLIVREEADVGRVARELYFLQLSKIRSRGG